MGGGNLTPVRDMMHVGDGIVVVVCDVEDVVVVDVVVEDVKKTNEKITRSAHMKFPLEYLTEGRILTINTYLSK